MTRQPIPSVTGADVERIIRRDFPPDRALEVLALLGEYVTGQGEPHRVRLAALKLAAGSVDRLRHQIADAKIDYRDTLAPAEYPGYGKFGFRFRELPQEEQQRIIDGDWMQYQDWLTK